MSFTIIHALPPLSPVDLFSFLRKKKIQLDTGGAVVVLVFFLGMVLVFSGIELASFTKAHRHTACSQPTTISVQVARVLGLSVGGGSTEAHIQTQLTEMIIKRQPAGDTATENTVDTWRCATGSKTDCA